MTIQSDGWRLQSQIICLALHYALKNIRKERQPLIMTIANFCTNKFSDIIPGALTEGYTTFDDYHWICEKCYTDFKDKFGWIIRI